MVNTDQADDRRPQDTTQRERKAKRIALLFVIVPVVATLAWAIFARVTRAPIKKEVRPTIAAGLPAPTFSFPSLRGGTIGLADQKDKLVVVNVWATWCPPCLEEMPSLERLYARMKKDGEPFEILAVSIDALGGDAVEKFVERFNLTFPILLDPRNQIKKLYSTTGVPETFIVDGQGRLVQKVIGAREWDSPEIVNYFKQVIRLGHGRQIAPNELTRPGAVVVK